MDDSDIIYPLDGDALRQRSIRGAAITSVSQLIKFGLMLASQIVLARLLFPADFGIIAMIAPVSGFVTVMADLGITQAIVQRPHLTRTQLNSVFWINVLLSISLALLLMLLAPGLAWFYHEPRLTAVTIAVAVLVVFTGLSMQQAALLNRTMRFLPLAISDILSLTMALFASALAAWEGLGYWSLIVGLLATTVTVNLVVWTASTWRPSFPAVKADAFSMLRFGGNVTVSNIALYLNSVVDNALVGWYLGTVPLGLYDRAWKLAVMPLSQLMAPVNRVAVPTLARLADDAERYRNAFGQMLRMLLLASLPALAVGIVAARPLIVLLFGSKWRDVAPIFSWLCVGSLLTPVNTAAFWMFLSQGRPRDQKNYGTAAAAINIVSYAIGLKWGVVGVAQTSAIISFLLPTPLLIWAASKSGPVSRSHIIRIIYPFAISTAGTIAVILFYNRMFVILGFLDLAIVTSLAYATTLILLGCFPSGRSAIMAGLNAVKSFKKP